MIFNCKVKKIEASDSHIYKVFIKPDKCFDFKAGQYVIVYLNGKNLPFSIANCPTCNELLELHVGGSKKNPPLKLFHTLLMHLFIKKSLQSMPHTVKHG